ncbi:MAG: hypothetical protein F2786_00115 [Actinobacteria bacterium]|uniref:Unannotated protein n=1 Tax=freshwater metagenome TaxID=449393 RepID=A0A6J7CCG2_9ZZZZ|nr:hypothetical protein [Actinomycetota bacterium]
MKRLLIIVIASLVVSLPANAATLKQISVKSLTPLTTIGSVSDVSGVLTRGSEIVIYGSRDDKSYVRAMDSSGKELWSSELSPDLNTIATAGTVDSSGNIWIAGSASKTVIAPAPTETLNPINPDDLSATIIGKEIELNAVAVWKIPMGISTPETFLNQQESAVLVNSITSDGSGTSLVGVIATETGSAGFLMSTDAAGTYIDSIKIGSQATNINSVLRNKDGSKTLVGSSSEVLGGKKLLGLTDGIIMALDSKNEVTKVVRSSEVKAKRSWNTASSTYLLGGTVIKGSTTQSAVTKFSKTFAPQWTYRFNSTGSTYTAGSSRALIASTSTIQTLRGWVPKTARALLLTFNTKGLITEAYSGPSKSNEVFGLIESKELGVVVFAISEQTISAFLAN